MVILKNGKWKYLPGDNTGVVGSYDIELIPPSSEELATVTSKDWLLIKRQAGNVNLDDEVIAILSSEKKVCELPSKEEELDRKLKCLDEIFKIINTGCDHLIKLNKGGNDGCD